MMTIDQIRAEWRRIYGQELPGLLPLLRPCEGQVCGCNLKYLAQLRTAAPIAGQ